MRKKKTPEHLPIHMVLQLANTACAKHGFEKLIGAELHTMFMTKRILPPVIRRNAKGMLWVDKWYVAIQLGDGDVEYLYLTKHHINEEIGSYRRLKSLREDAPVIPADIKEQFRIAYSWMMPTEQCLYFSEAAESLGLGWVNSWRNATRKELMKLLYTLPDEKRRT